MPGTNFENDADGYDPQDQSEAFDETNFTDGEDTSQARSFAGATDGGVFEDLPDVEDLTQIDGDRDDDETLAFDAGEFDPDAVDEADPEEDHELAYLAATEERQSDLDGLGPEDDFSEVGVARTEVEGGDEDLKRMGYAEDRDGETRARGDKGLIRSPAKVAPPAVRRALELEAGPLEQTLAGHVLVLDLRPYVAADPPHRLAQQAVAQAARPVGRVDVDGHLGFSAVVEPDHAHLLVTHLADQEGATRIGQSPGEPFHVRSLVNFRLSPGHGAGQEIVAPASDIEGVGFRGFADDH